MTAKKNFPLRIDPALFEVIEHWAADEFRSVNAHIEYLLRESARKSGRLPRKSLPQTEVSQGEDVDIENK